MAGASIYSYHRHWITPSVAPPPLPPATPVENPSSTTTDEVRTIFVSGLPEDVKERELQNLMRWLPGYEASQVNFKGEQPMGFALFSTAQQALAAKDSLQNMVFDAESKSVLNTEMAKKNLFVKRGVVTDSSSFDQSKRLRTGGDYTHTGYPSPSPFHPTPPASVWGTRSLTVIVGRRLSASGSGLQNQATSRPPSGVDSNPRFSYLAPSPSTYNPYGRYAVPPVPMPTPAPLPAPGGYAPVQNTKDNPPCNTLFIGNLGENVIESELRDLFSTQPGFKQMKILRQERNTVCFMEFEDVNSATKVHHNLQGAVIPSSGRGGMRIQYSKNPFGRRKDFNTSVPAAPGVNGFRQPLTYQ